MRNPFWITQYGHQPWVLVGIICIYMWYDARIQLPRSILIWLEFWNALTHLVATLYELGAPQGFVCWSFLAANLFNELEDRLESVHAEAQAPLQWEDAGSTVQRSLWQVRCMGSWYLVGVSRRSQYAFGKSLESLTSMRHVFIPSVPNEGLFKVSLKNWLFQASPQKGSVSAFGCFKWLCGTVKILRKRKVSHRFSWAILECPPFSQILEEHVKSQVFQHGDHWSLGGSLAPNMGLIYIEAGNSMWGTQMVR